MLIVQYTGRAQSVLQSRTIVVKSEHVHLAAGTSRQIFQLASRILRHVRISPAAAVGAVHATIHSADKLKLIHLAAVTNYVRVQRNKQNILLVCVQRYTQTY